MLAYIPTSNTTPPSPGVVASADGAFEFAAATASIHMATTSDKFSETLVLVVSDEVTAYLWLKAFQGISRRVNVGRYTG